MKKTMAIASIGTWIEHADGVCGGDARIRSTRIPVWTLVTYRALGLSDRELLDNYPNLEIEDLQAAWSYYEQHQAEIDRAIALNEEA